MQVKCTSCGASQNINQAQNCDFCGNLIELESAKNNYQSSLSGETGNLMAMAETAIEATNWDEALQYFNRVLEKDITNSDAWLGKGIAIVYTSKIGDLKITEAIAYWKNAIKHADNQEAMGKRVAKEINDVVNQFYPTLENHFIQFKDLENSYQDLVSKFATLEKAQDYAVNLNQNNVSFAKTGYNLCRRVIDIPKNYALADYGSAIAGAVIGTLQDNKYKRDSQLTKMSNARELKKQIENAAAIVKEIEQKYQNIILAIDPNDVEISKVKKAEIEEALNKEAQEKKDAKTLKQFWYPIFGFIIGMFLFGIIGGTIIELFGVKLTRRMVVAVIMASGALGGYLGYKKANK